MIDIRTLYQRVAPFRLDLPQAVYHDMLIQAVRRVFRESRPLNKTKVYELTAGQQAYDLSDIVTDEDILLITEIEILDTDTGKYVDLNAKNAALVKDGKQWREDRGMPSGYMIEYTKFSFLPVPDDIYSVRITYDYMPKDGLDKPNLPTDAEDAIVFQAVAFLLDFDGEGKNPQLAAAYESKADTEMGSLLAQTLFGNSGETLMKPHRAFARRGF